jgi:HEAT repeat protein
LGSIGLEAKAAGPELVTALKDPSVNVWSAAGPILARVDRHHRELAVASLIGQLKDLDEVRRFAAARALREIGRSAQAAVPALVERLSEETSVRTEAVRALGQIGPRAKAAVPALLQVIQKDDDPFKEASACAALALLQIDPHGKQIFPTVLRFLTDFVGDVKHADWMRRDGAYALATYGPKARTAIPVLRVALRDKSPTVRIAAAEAIAKIGGDVKEVIPILIRAVKEQDIQEGIGHFPATNGEAAEALGVIGPAAKEALPVLTQALIEKDYVLPGRIQVALAVVKIDSKVQIKAALAALRELTTAYGEGAEDAAEALVQVGPEAVPILVQMLKDERRGRTRAAATALAKLGSDASGAVRALRDVCHDPRPTVRRAVIDALGNIDPLSTQDLLLGALKDPAWSVREAAVQALGKPGFPRTEAILALLKMTKDKDLDVREAAVDVLKRIDPQGTK